MSKMLSARIKKYWQVPIEMAWNVVDHITLRFESYNKNRGITLFICEWSDDTKRRGSAVFTWKEQVALQG
jgi:hypothetical protein